MSEQDEIDENPPDKEEEKHEPERDEKDATIAQLTETINRLELRIEELTAIIESRHERSPSESHFWFRKIG